MASTPASSPSPCRRIEAFNGDARGVWEACCQGTVDATPYRGIEKQGGFACPDLTKYLDPSPAPLPFADMAPFTGIKVSFSSGIGGTFDSCRYASDPPPGTFVYSNPLRKVAGDLTTGQQRAMCSMVKSSIEMSGPAFPSASTTSRVSLHFTSDSHAVAPMVTRTNVSQSIPATTELVPCTDDDTEADKDPSVPGMCKRTVGGDMDNVRFADKQACTDAIEQRSVAMKYVTQARFYSWMCRDSKVRTDLFLRGQLLANMCGTHLSDFVNAAATNVGLANDRVREACSAVDDRSGILERLLDNVILLTSEGSSSRVSREDDVRVESLLKFPQINEAGVNMCNSLPITIHDSIFDANNSPLLGLGGSTRRLLEKCSFGGTTKMSEADINRLFRTLTYRPCEACSVDINPDVNLPGLKRLWPGPPQCGNPRSKAQSRANELDLLIRSLQEALSNNPLLTQDDNRPLLSDACDSLRLSPVQRFESEQVPLVQPGLWGLEYERWIKCASSSETGAVGNEHWAALAAPPAEGSSELTGKVALATAVVGHQNATKGLVIPSKLFGLRSTGHCAKDPNFNKDRLNMFRDNWVTSFAVIGKQLNPSTTYSKMAAERFAGLAPCADNIDTNFFDLHFR